MANKRQLGQTDVEPDAAPLGGVDFVTGALIPAIKAARLFHRTTRTLSNWEQRGLLPGVRIGRSVYFRAGDIERLKAGGAPSETDAPAPSLASTDGDSTPAPDPPSSKKARH